MALFGLAAEAIGNGSPNKDQRSLSGRLAGGRDWTTQDRTIDFLNMMGSTPLNSGFDSDPDGRRANGRNSKQVTKNDAHIPPSTVSFDSECDY